METITAKGGGDYEEAIEIGLWHANSEHEKNDISQVILIGDAPSIYISNFFKLKTHNYIYN